MIIELFILHFSFIIYLKGAVVCRFLDTKMGTVICRTLTKFYCFMTLFQVIAPAEHHINYQLGTVTKALKQVASSFGVLGLALNAVLTRCYVSVV